MNSVKDLTVPDPEASETWKRGDWMQTFTGRKFYPMSPRPEDIDPHDIAHSLAMQCRYNGHVYKFYSVAEHCVLMSQAVSPGNALWALLHDATEAYVGDMVRPLKLSMPEYREAEDRVMEAIAERFGLVPGGAVMPPEVKDADNRILLAERRALMSHHTEKWFVDDLEPLPVKITGWSPEVGYMAYIGRLIELGVDLD